MKVYIQTAVCIPKRASATFPLDMLRYDSCYPASETDAHKIENSFSHSGEGKSAKDLAITIVRAVTEPKRPFTVPRWESFGWSIDWTEERREGSVTLALRFDR